MIVNGIFTSEWDDNAAKFDTKGTLNTKTGKVESLEFIEGDVLEGLSCLTDEYFTDDNGKVHQICQTCHEYITKVGMMITLVMAFTKNIVVWVGVTINGN